MSKNIGFLLGLVLVLGPVSIEAKVLYVDRTTGSDSHSYAANGPTTPWATIGRAAWGSTNRSSPNTSQAARAGDVVIVRAGTYSVAGTDVRYDPAYNPANSGTSSAPIVFEAEGVVVLTLSSSRGPVIGAHERDYITWRGFTINEAQAPSRADTGPVVLSHSRGARLENLHLDGDGDPGYSDNHVGIRLQWASAATLRNNRITNFHTSNNNASNGAGIQVYYSGDVLIEHNEIFNCGSGIFLKAPADDANGTQYVDQFTIRYNRIYDTSYGIITHRNPTTAARPTRIYQNIVTDSNIAIRIWTFDQGATDPRNAIIVNNTLHNNNLGLNVNGNLVSNAGHRFFNNVVTNSDEYAINFMGSASTFSNSTLDVEHNLYWSFSRFGIVYSTEYTFSSWRTGTGQDSVAPASSNADPMYVNAAAGNFALRAGSPALSGGRDILDLDGDGSTSDTIARGAYVTGSETIGRTAGGPTAPTPPTNLRIIR